MDIRVRIVAIAALAAALFLPGSVGAQLYGIGGVIPISEAESRARTGDYFAIEGIVEDSDDEGVFRVRDDSGEMLVAIPEYLTRDQGFPEITERIRVSGKFDHKKLDPSVTGMRVVQLQRMGKVTGARGDAAPKSTAVVPTPQPAMPPAAQTGDAVTESIQPMAPAALKAQLRDARIQLDAARTEVDEAAGAWARATYEARDGGQVDPAVLERLQRAEARREHIVEKITPLIAEARKANVSPEVIQMYEAMTIERH